jgi:MoaA/NifB/PqqE/SkfB family radical SAM enzyme
MLEWLEIALDYRCNLRCLGCRACEDTGQSLTGVEVRALLAAREARNLWIGGGEPTLREDLFSVVVTAKKLGFERVLLQTNGLRLAYPSYLDALIRAGVTDVSLNVKSHRPEVHYRLSGREGAHALLLQALENLRGTELRRAADVLLTRSTVVDLPETIRRFATLGVQQFTLWLLSAADVDDPRVREEVPRIADIPIEAALETAREMGVELVSMHTPPCTLPAAARASHRPARDLRLRVVDPSGRSFPLESSPFEGGDFLPACDSCGARPRCHGPRADYIGIHGAREFGAI